MPARAQQKLASQLRSLGSRSSEAPPRAPLFQPSSTLCMLLNDLRVIRSKQADLSNALRASLPADWWGRPAGGGRGENLRLGDRFKLCQVCCCLNHPGVSACLQCHPCKVEPSDCQQWVCT